MGGQKVDIYSVPHCVLGTVGSQKGSSSGGENSFEPHTITLLGRETQYAGFEIQSCPGPLKVLVGLCTLFASPHGEDSGEQNGGKSWHQRIETFHGK